MSARTSTEALLKMLEIEVKAKVKSEKKLEETLRKLGAKFDKEVEEEDIYFAHPSRDFGKTDEALRLRKMAKPKKEFFFTYKGKKIDKITKTREELTINLESNADYEKTKEILLTLGFREVMKINKRRKLFRFKNFLISIDSVKNLGTFAEIEKKSKKYDAKEMLGFMKRLGLKQSITKSYLELLMDGKVFKC